MSLPTNWRDDPMVRVEAMVLPLLFAAARLLYRMSDGDAEGREDWYDRSFKMAEEMQHGFPSLFEGSGHSLRPDTTALAASVAEEVRRFAVAVQQAHPGDRDAGRALIGNLENRVEPSILHLLDAIREDFIGTVLCRQATYAESANRAMGELSTVSRRIFFISINASIEAARAGDGGRGFSLIAQEIRSLARLADGSIGILRDQTPD
ncbi:MAG: methyl-accepting chemotaxis protein [Shimia sp.]